MLSGWQCATWCLVLPRHLVRPGTPHPTPSANRDNPVISTGILLENGRPPDDAFSGRSRSAFSVLSVDERRCNGGVGRGREGAPPRPTRQKRGKTMQTESL